MAYTVQVGDWVRPNPGYYYSDQVLEVVGKTERFLTLDVTKLQCKANTISLLPTSVGFVRSPQVG